MRTSTVPVETSAERGMFAFFNRHKQVIFFIVAVLLGLIVTRLPIADLGLVGHVTLAVFVFTVVLWVGEVLPVGLAGVLFCILLLVFLGKRMPMQVVFSGFANSTFWLVVGAFMLGQATVETGLAQRIAFLTMRLGGSSHRMILVYLWVAQGILGLLTPSAIVRVAIFIPIMLGIAQAYKARPDSRFSANLLIHIFWAQDLGSQLWYTGTIVNPATMGMLKAVTGYSPSYFVYLVWNFVPTMIWAVGTFILIELILPAEKEIVSAGNADVLNEKLAEMGAITKKEWRTLFFFVIAVILWATEKLHHIDTASVAMIFGILLFLPDIGVLKPKSLNGINWDIILLIGVALGITNVMSMGKLDVWVTNKILAPILNPFAAYGSAGLDFGISLAVGLVHFIAASATGETALLCPLIVKFSQLSGYNTALAALATSRAEMNIFLFPYQVAPLIVLWGTGYMDMKKCLRTTIATAIFNIAWITAMGPVWAWTMAHFR